MSEPFLAEIRMFAGNFAPRGWALCNGQLLRISQNTTLFSLLGTAYGGDGRTTFALPNLKGRAPMQPGQGPGLTPRTLGETMGVTSVTLSMDQMAAHNHGLMARAGRSNQASPVGNVLGRMPNNYAETTANVRFPANSVAAVGGNQPHNNMQPYLVVNFIIALEGVFPQRP